MSRDFIDTNIVLYANDMRDTAKQQLAVAVIARAIRDDTGVISIQVLQEYAHVALARLGQRQELVLRQLALLEILHVVTDRKSVV